MGRGPRAAGFVGADVSKRSRVLFDFDGTLADTRAGIVRTATRVLAEWGLAPEEIGDAGRLVGPPFPGAFHLVYGSLGVSAGDAEEITRRYRLAYDRLGKEGHRCFPGTPEMLERLRESGRHLAVATSRRQPLALQMLRDQGILEHFDVVVGQTDPTRASKSDIIGETLDALGTSADDAVMVGDRHYDVDGAAACGVPCVGALFGSAPRSELEEAGACAIVEDVASLADVLLGNAGGLRG